MQPLASAWNRSRDLWISRRIMSPLDKRIWGLSSCVRRLQIYGCISDFISCETTSKLNNSKVIMFELRDKVCLVTGGAAGIGAGIVREFLNEGAKHVAALDVDVINGENLEKEMKSKHGPNKIKFYKCDVTSTELNEAYDDVVRELKHIDVVVNCAGIMNDSPNVYLKELAVNVNALITSSFKAFDLMRNDKGGKGGTIINISSIVGLFQPHLLPVYAATKSAVLQFSNCLGNEFHYNRSGVRVITLCFGCTDTTLLSSSKMAAFDMDLDVLVEKGIKNLPSQKPESAVTGLIYAYKHGVSGSTWLVTSERPAEDISGNVTKAYEILSQGVFY